MGYLALNRAFCGRSSGLLIIDTIFDFRVAYRSENLPLKYEQLVLLPFGQHSRLTAVEQAWADQGLVNDEFGLA
jgi:hypothetical protein